MLRGTLSLEKSKLYLYARQRRSFFSAAARLRCTSSAERWCLSLSSAFFAVFRSFLRSYYISLSFTAFITAGEVNRAPQVVSIPPLLKDTSVDEDPRRPLFSSNIVDKAVVWQWDRHC
eukprot:IDg5816t1